ADAQKPSAEIPAEGPGRGFARMSEHPERTGDYLPHTLSAIDRIQQYLAGKSETDCGTPLFEECPVCGGTGKLLMT
ncbi:MAG TPA: hypothetical protein VGS10_13745, partial [Terracidiphilus sp.]|nr:hypothetical protein [Terracidiphilus sp.]